MDCLVGIILAARNDDGGWMQILIFLIVTAFWLIGGFLKARANKIGDKDFPEEQGDEDVKPNRQQQPHKWIERIRQVPVEAKTGIRKREIPKLKLKSLFDAEPVKIEPVIKPMSVKLTPKSSESTVKTGAEISVESLFNRDDPNSLQKAILHYEVLGKPMALRGPVDMAGY